MAKQQQLSLDTLLEQALVKDKDRPYEVPENWVWTRLGIVCRINPPKVTVKALPHDLDVSFVPMSAVSEISGSIINIETKKLCEVKNGYTNFTDGDILFAKITPCMENGKAAIALDLANAIGYGSTEFHVLRVSKCVLNKFIYYLVRAKWFREDAKLHMSGSVGQQRVPKHYMETYKFPIPPLSEQQRIVDVIESLFEKLDRAKELAQNALDSFENRKSSILHQAFTGELTRIWRKKNPDIQSADNLLKEIQEEKLVISDNKSLLEFDLGETPFKLVKNWTWCNLGRLVYRIEAGKNFSCPEIPVVKGNVGLVKISAVTWGKFDYTETKTVTDESKINKEYFIRKGDFLFSRANTIELVGISVIVDYIDHDIMISDKIWRVKFLKGLELYVNYYLKSIYGRKEIEKKATGNQFSMRNISQDSFRSILIPLPPLEEQKEIVRILDNLLEKEQKAKELCDVIDKIDHIKKAILARAFRGELGTNKPDEESALELLKEVLKEKAPHSL